MRIEKSYIEYDAGNADNRESIEIFFPQNLIFANKSHTFTHSLLYIFDNM